MRPKSQSKHLLKTTQSKAKMYEYNVPSEYHIRLERDPLELIRLTIGILGDITAQINRSPNTHTSNIVINNDYKENLIFCAQFFDNYLNAQLNTHSETIQYLLLLGASAYYLCDQPGSASVLANGITEDLADFECDGIENLLLWILKGDLNNSYGGSEGIFSQYIDNIFICYKNYFLFGINLVELIQNLSKLREKLYFSGSPRQLLFIDILFAVIRKKIENASYTVLSSYSELPIEYWAQALQKKIFIKEFWPAQHYIGQQGALKGLSSVIQMPTSAGKTKAVELILRSSFLSGRTSLALIIAPFRALCHEIKAGLVQTFQGENIDVEELSDTLQMDFNLDELFGFNVYKTFGTSSPHKRVVVVTPEKLLYVLHHSPEIASKVGLVIFDEGHQFDNGSRGITYELLLTSLNLLFPESIQKVFISAVISNSKAIANWLNHNDNVINGSNLVPSFKTIGFTSWTSRLGQIYYFSNNIDLHDYFVPRVIEQLKLQRIGREKNQRVFPEKNDGKSIALYLGLKLIHNGSIAIFCGQKRTVSSLCNTLVDAIYRGLSIDVIKFSCESEVTKLYHLIMANLGADSAVTKCAYFGVFSHHGNIPQGIRLAIEHAMRENLIKFVICTSTLAQGVNLPIRYLIVADVHQGQEKIKTRDFQNLIGRAGRSGMHTEGSILFADNTIYDNGKFRSNNWRWYQIKKLLNPNESEPCISSLMEVFKPITSDNGKISLNFTYEQFVSTYLQAPKELPIKILYYTLEEKAHFSIENLKRQIYFKIDLISAIESFLLFHLSNNEIQNVTQLAQSTLAYRLAQNDTEKNNIINLFQLIAQDISRKVTDPKQKAIYSKALYSRNYTDKIRLWLDDNINHLLVSKTQLDLLNYIWSLLVEFIENANFNKFVNPDVRLNLAQQWIDGKSYYEIFNHISVNKIKKIYGQSTTDFKVDDIIDMFENGLSYDGTLFINALIILIEASDQENINGLVNNLKFLQKRIKYGLPSKTAITIYELGFMDRVISIDLANFIGHQELDSIELKNIIKYQYDEISKKIESYPSYFKNLISTLNETS